MTNTRKSKKVKGYNVNKEIANIDHLFRGLEKDKSLPTFGDFFMECLILGIAENVNLKSMYPAVYKKLNAFLKQHNAKILAMRK